MAILARRGALLEDFWESRFVRGLLVMWAVIYALVLRESRTRHGTSDIGYAWALIEPLIQMLVLWGVYVVFARHVPIAASMPVFLVTGILPYYFWSDCVRRGASAVSSNIPLLTYPQVRPFDVVVARILLEAATTAVVVVIFVVGLKLFRGEPLSSWYDEPLPQVTAVLALFYFGFSAAIFSSSLARIFRPWEAIFGYLSRPLWFTSGIFFTMTALPRNVREIAEYNPILHMLEWIRSASLPGFESDLYSRSFVLTFATVLLLIGLAIDRILTIIGHSDHN